tara:strand:- start:123 stop:425 length:303 start_codon:yes stop_codon:yes gene_type:complete
MELKRVQQEYKEALPGEITNAVIENFLFGLSGALIVPFIAVRFDVAVLICYMIHYFYISKVINRPKYVTSLAKFILFPIPTALGGFTGYKIAYLLSNLLQ